jgi:hypothetical protein
MLKKAAAAESVPKTDTTVLSQISGVEQVGPDLHVFPWDSQELFALLGITTAQAFLESNDEELAASYVGWRDKTVSLDDAMATVREWKSRLGVPVDPTGEPAGINDDYFSDGADLSSADGCSNKAVIEHVGDNMPIDETATDGTNSGDEPPAKRRRFD